MAGGTTEMSCMKQREQVLNYWYAGDEIGKMKMLYGMAWGSRRRVDLPHLRLHYRVRR